MEGISARMKELNIEGRDLAQESAPIQAQILFSRFRQYIESQPSFADIEASHREAVVGVRWRDLLREVLYEGVATPDELLVRHGYTEALAALAYSTPIVVTYNFDDLLEHALSKSPRKPNGTVGYFPAWGSSFVVQENRPVVYHPNGYLPFYAIDRYSEQLILTEQSLSDQIIDSAMGSYSLLLDYYSKTTCLFLGFSLTDPALRSMLRQSVRRSPGTVHYYIRYCDGYLPPKGERAETIDTNFDLFNMVTLYLNGEEIKALLELVAQVDGDSFNDACVRAGMPTTYLHYITGPVSVGKTSIISRLQGIEIVDEWLKPRDPLIAKPSIDLTDEERTRVDKWILEQLRLKNARYEHAQLGLHVMDRAPLDAFAFPPYGEPQKKAQDLYDYACAGASGKPHHFCPGKLIILSGRPYDLLTRQVWRGRSGSEGYVADQQAALLAVYNAPNAGRTFHVDTTGLPVEVVIKKVLRVMHLEPYEQFDFSLRLKHYLSGAK